MVLLHALVLASAAVPPPAAPVRVEARASVRIVRGATIRWGDRVAMPPTAQRTRASVRLEDGRRQPARLIEFE